MRDLLSKKVHFEIWSIDPYTAGGPSHEPPHPNDVSVARLPEMKSVLDAAVKAGNIVSTRPVRFWVSEFAWDSNPPDPGGVPVALEGRWVAESLYRMWSAGVSLVTWFTLRDQSRATSPYQSGLYFLGSTFARDRPKPALTAFRFPFVAYPAGKRISVWGRTPTSRRARWSSSSADASSWDVVARLARRSGRNLLGPGSPERERPAAGAVPGREGDVAPVLAREPARPPLPAVRGARAQGRRRPACERGREPVRRELCRAAGGGTAAGTAMGARTQILLLVAALAAILLALAAAAFRRRQPRPVQPRL